jgi:hypothetical protein
LEPLLATSPLDTLLSQKGASGLVRVKLKP